MKQKNDALGQTYTLAELCELSGLSIRTARYYIQIGLVDKPEGETRAARYGAKHLEQLLLVQKWVAAGVSLERIRDQLQGAVELPRAARRPGSLEVKSHLLLAEGVELVIEPGAAGMSPDEVRAFAKSVMALYADMKKNTKHGEE